MEDCEGRGGGVSWTRGGKLWRHPHSIIEGRNLLGGGCRAGAGEKTTSLPYVGGGVVSRRGGVGRRRSQGGTISNGYSADSRGLGG